MTAGPRGRDVRERFEVEDVSGWPASHHEDLGSKAKVWLRSPSGQKWLFKYARREDDQAEDWPEKAAAELAVALGIPAATVALADRSGHRGVISLDVAQGWTLEHGNELLYARDPSYQLHLPRPDQGYTLDAVREILTTPACSTPPGWVLPSWSAYDVFAGYLVLDALIANQDRHHENWGVLLDEATGRRALAPSFDHASSLGFMLTDAERRERLTTNDQGRSVSHWAARGRSHFEGRPGLVALARDALASCSSHAAAVWLDRLRETTTEVWDTILSRLPKSRVSDPARIFASEVLTVNRGRLLDACDDLRGRDAGFPG